MKNSTFAKNFVIGVLYASILGAIIYEPFNLIITSVYKWEANGYLLSLPKDIIIKSAILFCSLAFFCCDFLYTMLSKVYRPFYLVNDGVTLLGLSLIFKAVKIDSTEIPSFNLICASFAIIMLFHLVWSISRFSKFPESKKDENGVNHYKYYRTTAVLTGILFVGFLTLTCFAFRENPDNIFVAVFSIAAIALSVCSYIYAIRERKDLFV